jgi:5'/3'-nucleotidase SurE
VHKDSFREDGSWDEEYQPEKQHTNGHTNGLAKGHLTNGTTTTDNDNNDSNEDDGPTQDEWVIIENGTPASCTQLGLHNLFTNRPQIDLVISGPNHGRNASTIYNLSSGTVGGALEAVFCGKRGIAISFGSKDEQPADVIAAAARLAVRVVGFLYKNWDERVELYNINVPMRVDVEERPVIYTRTLPYYWNRGCLYAEDLGKKGVNGVNGAVNGEVNGVNGHEVKSRKRQFKWSADLSDMKKTMQESEEGTDAHTVLNGSTRYVFLFL